MARYFARAISTDGDDNFPRVLDDCGEITSYAQIMHLTDQLTEVARAFCEARNLSLSRVSTLVFNDGKKLGAIAANEADLSTGKFEHAMVWFSENWPAGTAWPRGIDRPSVKQHQ